MVRHPHNISRLAPADAQSEADDTTANVRRDRDNPLQDPKKKQQNDTLFLASYCLVCSESEITNATETRTRCLPTLMIVLCLEPGRTMVVLPPQSRPNDLHYQHLPLTLGSSVWSENRPSIVHSAPCRHSHQLISSDSTSKSLGAVYLMLDYDSVPNAGTAAICSSMKLHAIV